MKAKVAPNVFITRQETTRLDGKTIEYSVYISPDLLRLQALKAAKSKGGKSWDGALLVVAEVKKTEVKDA